MRRGVAALGLVVVASVIGLLGAATPAQASTINYSSLTSADQAKMEQVLLDWSQNPGYVADATENEGLAAAAVAGGEEEGLSALLGVSGGAGALAVGVPYITYRIANSLGLGGWVYRTITHEDPPGCCGGATATLTGGIQWFYCPIPWTGSVGYPCVGYSSYDVQGWIAEAMGIGYDDVGTNHTTVASLGAEECVGGASYNNPNTVAALGGLPYIASGHAGYCASGTAAVASGATSAPTTAAQADGQMLTAPYGYREVPATASDWAGTPSSQQFTAPGPANTTCNSTCLQAALNADKCGTPVSQNVVQAAGCNAIAEQCACNGDPGVQLQAIELLQPYPNETYNNYVSRLQGEGYLGTVTETAEPTALSGYGPNAVTRVQYPSDGGRTLTLDPLQWPATNPTLAPNSAITVRYNPSTAPPAPSVSSPSSSGETFGTGGSVPSLDLSPLEDLNPGCSFPFGFFCYAQTFTSWFNVTPQGPDFDFGTITTPTLGNGRAYELGKYDVNLGANASLNTYMGYIRDAETVFLWVAAVWFLASRLLGFNAGDPTEAIGDGTGVVD